MAKIKAMSFDMYRTLIDTKDFHEQAVREILRRAGAKSVSVDDFHARWDERYEDVHLELGPTGFMREREVATESLRRALREFGIESNPEEGVEIWLSQYKNADLYPEVAEVLKALSKHYPMVVVSNVDNDDLGYMMFRKKKLPFIAILTSESFRSYKPYERMFLEALEILKCEPEEVLHIGDSPRSDFLGGRKAGMAVAWLNRNSSKLNRDIPKPDYEITNLRELLDLKLR